jgi:hypothetical protein
MKYEEQIKEQIRIERIAKRKNRELEGKSGSDTPKKEPRQYVDRVLAKEDALKDPKYAHNERDGSFVVIDELSAPPNGPDKSREEEGDTSFEEGGLQLTFERALLPQLHTAEIDLQAAGEEMLEARMTDLLNLPEPSIGLKTATAKSLVEEFKNAQIGPVIERRRWANSSSDSSIPPSERGQND